MSTMTSNIINIHIHDVTMLQRYARYALTALTLQSPPEPCCPPSHLYYCLATRPLINLEPQAPLVTETEEASHQLQIPFDFRHNCSAFLS